MEFHKSRLFSFQGLKIDHGLSRHVSSGSRRPDSLKLSLPESPARQQFSRKAIVLCLAPLQPMTVMLLPGQTRGVEGRRSTPKNPGPWMTPWGESWGLWAGSHSALRPLQLPSPTFLPSFGTGLCHHWTYLEEETFKMAYAPSMEKGRLHRWLSG